MKTRFPNIRRDVLASTIALLTAVSAASQAEAQDSGANQLEEIVVTGSLIRRQNIFDGRSPVQSLQREGLEATGAVQAVEVLKNLTQNSGSNLASEQGPQQGTSQFSLRGLGLGSTLTLVNGRRGGISPVANASGTDFLDINTLPFTMIQGIDVLTDGASATYGSQAVAGVANIITRKGFEGFEVSAGFRNASYDAQDIGFAFGTETDSGHFNLYGAYYQQDRNFRLDFPWLRTRVYDPNGDGNITEGSLDSGNGSPGTYFAAVDSDGNGLFEPVSTSGSRRNPDPDCLEAGGYLQSNRCRMDFANQRSIIPEEERVQLFGEFDHQLGDSVQLFGEIGYSRNQVRDAMGPMVFENGNIELTPGGGTNNFQHVPANHPFNFWVNDPASSTGISYIGPNAWNEAAHGPMAADLAIQARPLGAEVNGEGGAADVITDFNNYRLMGGLNIDLANSWTATGHYAFSESRFTREEPHQYVADVYTDLLQRGAWNPFGTRLVSPTLVSPRDGVSVAGNDPDVQALFDGFGVSTARTRESVIEGVASGEFIETDAGPIYLAVGAQYRDLSLVDVPDGLEGTTAGRRSGRLFRTTGEQQVWSVFAESIIPISDFGELQVALRHESYDVAGSTTDPKISAQIRASDSISLRGSWGTSFQAPSLRQLAGATSNGTLDDPFDDNLSCNMQNPQGQRDNNTTQRVAGGADLGPQSAENLNLGILFNPGDNFRASIDYWSFDYEDVIAQNQSFQSIVNDDCADDGIANDPRITRVGGQLAAVAAAFVNVGQVQTDGIDVSAEYDLNIDAGNITLFTNVTNILGFDVNSGGGFSDQLGVRNFRNGFAPTPEMRYNAGANFASNNLVANLTYRYIDGYGNDQNNPIPEIDSWGTIDASVAYTIRDLLGNDSEATIQLGVINATDEDPPGLRTNAVGAEEFDQRPGYDGQVHSIFGRAAYVRLKYLF